MLLYLEKHKRFTDCKYVGGQRKDFIFREEKYFLATLVALHFTPVSKSVGRSFELG